MNQENYEDSILDRVCIAMPCSVDWDDMKGDDKVRLCGGCNKNVYNLSSMSKKEAEDLLASPELPCIQISRADNGKILTDQKPRLISWLCTHGKRAMSALVSVIATIAPQWAAAADEKTKELYTRGKPAAISPRVDPSNTQLKRTPPPMPGVPIYVPRTPGDASLWPGAIAGLGITKEDLKLNLRKQFSAADIAAIDAKNFDVKNIPAQLDTAAWELFYKARKLHFKALMRLANKDTDKALHDCQESHKFYQLALEQISRGRHDEAFAAFIYQEHNKTSMIELQCRQCLGPEPRAK